MEKSNEDFGDTRLTSAAGVPARSRAATRRWAPTGVRLWSADEKDRGGDSIERLDLRGQSSLSLRHISSTLWLLAFAGRISGQRQVNNDSKVLS